MTNVGMRVRSAASDYRFRLFLILGTALAVCVFLLIPDSLAVRVAAGLLSWMFWCGIALGCLMVIAPSRPVKEEDRRIGLLIFGFYSVISIVIAVVLRVWILG